MKQENKNKIVAAVNICRMYFNLHSPVIGGSAAMLAQGLPFREDLHDVDVIVTLEQLNLIKKLAEHFKLKQGSKKSGSSHYCLDIQGYLIDFVAGDVLNVNKINNVYYQDISTVFAIKKKWKRQKDVLDLIRLARKVNMKYNTRLMFYHVDDIRYGNDNRLYVTAIDKTFIL